METYLTEEGHRPNGHDLERRGTARRNIPMMRRSLHNHREDFGRPGVDNDAAFGCPGLDQLPHNQGVANSNKRNRKNKTKKRKKRKNCRND